jgi:hypothetical protein
VTGKLGDILIRQGVLDAEKLTAALSDQQAFGGKLGRTLVELGYVSEDQLVAGLAQQLGLTTVDLATAEIEVDALSCLPVDACERYGVFPVRVNREEGVLWLATAEPDRNALQEVAQIAQLTLEPMLSPMSSIDRAVRQHYYGEHGAPKARLGEPLAGIPLDPGQKSPALAQAVPKAKGPAARANSFPDLPDEQPAAQAALPVAPVEVVVVAPEQPEELEVLEESSLSDEPALAEEPELTNIAPTAAAPDSSGTEEIRLLLLRIEKQVNAQGRVFRSLVELLQEKGVVRRGELGSRAVKK